MERSMQDYGRFDSPRIPESTDFRMTEDTGRWMRDNTGMIVGVGLLTVAMVGAGYLVYRYASQPTRRDRHAMMPGGSVRATGSVVIDRPVEEVYAAWRDLESLPTIMSHLESVRELPESGKSHWTAQGPAGTKVEWDAVLVEERENERLAWHSVGGARVPNEGSVRFRPAPGGGTEVDVSLTYHPPGGKMAQGIAAMFGREPNQQLEEDLKRFKQRLESKGTIHGAVDHTSSAEQP